MNIGTCKYGGGEYIDDCVSPEPGRQTSCVGKKLVKNNC